jgi:hypothetical protein
MVYTEKVRKAQFLLLLISRILDQFSFNLISINLKRLHCWHLDTFPGYISFPAFLGSIHSWFIG